MRPYLARFSEPVCSGHLPSWADFITATPELKFLVHTGMLRQLTGRMDAGLKQRKRDEQGLATLASLVGALVLARAVNDPELSDAILRATKKQLDD